MSAPSSADSARSMGAPTIALIVPSTFFPDLGVLDVKKFLSLVLALGLIASSTFTLSASAADSLQDCTIWEYALYELGNNLSDDTIQGRVLSPVVRALKKTTDFFGRGLCPDGSGSPDGLHHADHFTRWVKGLTVTPRGIAGSYLECKCKFCGENFRVYGEDAENLYGVQMAGLDSSFGTRTFTPDGVIWRPNLTDLYGTNQRPYIYFSHSTGSFSWYLNSPQTSDSFSKHGLTFAPSFPSGDRFELYFSSDSVTYGSASIGYKFLRLMPPISGLASISGGGLFFDDPSLSASISIPFDRSSFTVSAGSYFNLAPADSAKLHSFSSGASYNGVCVVQMPVIKIVPVSQSYLNYAVPNITYIGNNLTVNNINYNSRQITTENHYTFVYNLYDYTVFSPDGTSETVKYDSGSGSGGGDVIGGTVSLDEEFYTFADSWFSRILAAINGFRQDFSDFRDWLGNTLSSLGTTGGVTVAPLPDQDKDILGNVISGLLGGIVSLLGSLLSPLLLLLGAVASMLSAVAGSVSGFFDSFNGLPAPPSSDPEASSGVVGALGFVRAVISALPAPLLGVIISMFAVLAAIGLFMILL